MFLQFIITKAISLTKCSTARIKRCFRCIRYKSGYIPEKELGNIFKALNVKVSDSQLKKIVTEIDADRSDQIEFDEFCRVMGESFFKKYSQDELRLVFRQFDQDGSGYIEADELENIMHKMRRRYNKCQN